MLNSIRKYIRKAGLSLGLGLGLGLASAPAFAFGPLVQQAITAANGVTLTTTATPYNVFSFVLQPGTWLCTATLNVTPAGTTMGTVVAAFGTTSAGTPTFSQTSGYVSSSGGGGTTLPSANTPITIFEVPNSVGASKTYYLTAYASFTGTAPKAYGALECLKLN